MGNNGLSNFAKNVKLATEKYQPEILTGLGIAGFITTTVLAVKATPKALEVLAEIKKNHEEDTDKKAYCKDVVTKVVPLYLPATLVGGLSIGCFIGATKINTKRNAALAAAYALSESALKDYKEKVVETIGEKKEKTVREAVAKDKVEKTPLKSSEVIMTGDGDELCLDYYSGRYFRSTADKLRKAENNINRRLLLDNYISLNEFYAEIGLGPTKQGEQLGWNIARGYLKLDIDYIPVDDKPCLVLDYDLTPQHGFDKFM